MKDFLIDALFIMVWFGGGVALEYFDIERYLCAIFGGVILVTYLFLKKFIVLGSGCISDKAKGEDR